MEENISYLNYLLAGEDLGNVYNSMPLILHMENLYTFILTSLLDLSKYDYFHICMDFVILYGSME
jgi:hypothetical protein